MNKIKIWRLKDNIDVITEWAKSGLSRKEIAEKIGISFRTLKNWCVKYDDIKNALRFCDDTFDMCQKFDENITQKSNKKSIIDFNSSIEKNIKRILKKFEKGIEDGDLLSVVEYSLFKRAVGYEYFEQKTEYTEKSGEKIIFLQKHFSPDINAQMIWLKTYKSEIWKDKNDFEEKEQQNVDIKISFVDENGIEC